MKVLLISLQQDLDTIGLKFLHYYLLKNGHESSILYLPKFSCKDRVQLESIKKFIERFKPGLIGISLMSVEFYNARDLTNYIKIFSKSVPIIWGGIHSMIDPEDCLNFADYVCVGEGEKTLLEVVNALEKNENPKNINNVCFKDNGIVKKNPLFPLMEDLDEIPFYEHIPQSSFIFSSGRIVPLTKGVFKKYNRFSGGFYSAMTTRGCPFSCTYCCNNFFSRLYGVNKIRRRSVENIITELKENIKKNPEIEYVNFQDDCFLACSDDYLSALCTVYKKEIAKPFIIRAIPTFLNVAKMKMLKEAGIAWISVGLQSGSDRTCREIYKRKSLKADFLKAAQIIKDFKVAPFYDVILDNPFENEADGLETIDTLIKTPKPFYTQFFSLVFYRGTEIYEKLKLETPSVRDSYLEKDNMLPRKNTINNLIRLATFIPEKLMNKLIAAYKKNFWGTKLRIYLFFLNVLNVFIFEPLTFFQVIKLTQCGSYIKTFEALPIYLKKALKNYLDQFKSE